MSGIFFIIDNPQNINNHQYTAIEMFINNVNVLFLSNSQLKGEPVGGCLGCLSIMSMSSF